MNDSEDPQEGSATVRIANDRLTESLRRAKLAYKVWEEMALDKADEAESNRIALEQLQAELKDARAEIERLRQELGA